MRSGPTLIADAGPIVAWLTRSDARHRWASEQFARLRPPLVTCEAVLAEAAFLVEYAGGNAAAIPTLVSRGIFRLPAVLAEDSGLVAQLMNRYRNVPMSLADACLVRLSETEPNAVVFTLDADFRIYRRRGRSVIPVLMPDER